MVPDPPPGAPAFFVVVVVETTNFVNARWTGVKKKACDGEAWEFEASDSTGALVKHYELGCIYGLWRLESEEMTDDCE